MNRVALAALIVGLFVTACQEEERPAPERQIQSVTDDEPCDLLSIAQVERALSTRVRNQGEVGSHQPGVRLCRYGVGRPYASITVYVEHDVRVEEFEKRRDRDPINTKNVAGFGDGAFIHACVSLSLLSDDAFVAVGVQHFDTCEDTAGVLRRLADQVLLALGDGE